MPADNIKRAIMRGTGELEGGQIDEILFEGYGPGGAAVLVNVATDNRNRTVSEIRHVFSKNGGNLGEQGSVAWMFERKSQIIVDGEKANEDQLMDLAARCGRRRYSRSGRRLGNSFGSRSARSRPEGAGEGRHSDGIGRNRHGSQEHREAGRQERAGMLKLYDVLEEHDDVQNVYGNYEIDEEEVEALA